MSEDLKTIATIGGNLGTVALMLLVLKTLWAYHTSRIEKIESDHRDQLKQQGTLHFDEIKQKDAIILRKEEAIKNLALEKDKKIEDKDAEIQRLNDVRTAEALESVEKMQAIKDDFVRQLREFVGFMKGFVKQHRQQGPADSAP